jgi:hypothetical protein
MNLPSPFYWFFVNGEMLRILSYLSNVLDDIIKLGDFAQ